MWFLFTSLALAGPPLHACDVDSSGTIGVVSPKNKAVYVLAEGDLKKVADVDVADNHVIVARSGGWWTGTSPVMEVTADGSVARAGAPAPLAFWDALKGGSVADTDGTTSLLVTRDDTGGVVFRNEDGGAQTQLWEFEGWAAAPKVLHRAGSAIYAVGHATITKRSADGTKVTGEVPLPDRDTIGLCGGDGSVPLTAVVFGSRREACVKQWAGGAWKDIACTSPL